MKEQPNALAIQILDKEYRIACDEGEEEALQAAGKMLNDRMIQIRKTGKVIGVDRIAVMAALNMAHELISTEDTQVSESTSQRIRTLRDKVEIALNDVNQLEL